VTATRRLRAKVNFGENSRKLTLGLRRKVFGIRLNPDVYHAFKLLCDASGYREVNEAVEKIMIKCIESESLGLEPKGYDKMASRLAQWELIKRKLKEKGVKI